MGCSKCEYFNGGRLYISNQVFLAFGKLHEMKNVGQFFQEIETPKFVLMSTILKYPFKLRKVHQFPATLKKI